MRLVHLSDTHLGYSAYSRLDPSSGINQREKDVYDAFQQAVDKAISLKPDIVVHSGDLFDTVRPQNRAIDFALKQLIRLSEAGIETVLISGNHSTPRLRETGNIFRIFEHLPHIHPVHEPGVAKLLIGDAAVFAIPHSTHPSIAELLAEAEPSRESKLNVLVLHASILGSDLYRMDEFNEQAVQGDLLDDAWDYVALGHFHGFAKVGDRAHYSGSTERTGFGEAGQEKGIVEVDLRTHSVRFHPLELRGMIDLPELDAAGLASSEILRESRDLVGRTRLDDRIARLVISNVAPDAHKSLDIAALRRLGSSALHFELKIERLEAEPGRQSEGGQIGLLADEFRKFVSSLTCSDSKKSRLLELGMPYFEGDED